LYFCTIERNANVNADGNGERNAVNGKHQMRKRQNVETKRTGKRATTTPAGFGPITTLDDAWTVARNVTMANFADAIAAANANHGVSHTGRNVCRFTGVRIQFAQNASFVKNAEPGFGLSDVGLLFVWCVQFPMASGAVFSPNRPGSMPLLTAVHIVNGARRSFNAGQHGNAVAPAVASVRYAVAPAVAPASPVNVADAKIARRRR